jgi:hypothetical protein
MINIFVIFIIWLVAPIALGVAETVAPIALGVAETVAPIALGVVGGPTPSVVTPIYVSLSRRHLPPLYSSPTYVRIGIRI